MATPVLAPQQRCWAPGPQSPRLSLLKICKGKNVNTFKGNTINSQLQTYYFALLTKMGFPPTKIFNFLAALVSTQPD